MNEQPNKKIETTNEPEHNFKIFYVKSSLKINFPKKKLGTEREA